MNLNENILAKIDALIEEFQMTNSAREQAKTRPASTGQLTPGGPARPVQPKAKTKDYGRKSKYAPATRM